MENVCFLLNSQNLVRTTRFFRVFKFSIRYCVFLWFRKSNFRMSFFTERSSNLAVFGTHPTPREPGRRTPMFHLNTGRQFWAVVRQLCRHVELVPLWLTRWQARRTVLLYSKTEEGKVVFSFLDRSIFGLLFSWLAECPLHFFDSLPSGLADLQRSACSFAGALFFAWMTHPGSAFRTDHG